MNNTTAYKNPSRERLLELSRPEQYKLAKEVGVNGHYIYQIAKGIRTGSRELNIKIEALVKGFSDKDFTEEVRDEIHKNGGPL